MGKGFVRVTSLFLAVALSIASAQANLFAIENQAAPRAVDNAHQGFETQAIPARVVNSRDLYGRVSGVRPTSESLLGVLRPDRSARVSFGLPARVFLMTAFFYAAILQAQAGSVFTARFNQPNGLLTNEYAEHNLNRPEAVRSPDWDVTSGSLFIKDSTAWTGVPDAGTPDPASKLANHSAVLRAITHRADFQNVVLTFLLRVNGFGSTAKTPAQAFDGVHVMLRYVSQYTLYYVSVSRRDNKIIVKKKVEGGPNPSNGGTYYELTPSVPYSVPLGRWQHLKVTIQDTPEGAVKITLYRVEEGREERLLEALDQGIGGPPIRDAGHVGIRSDNAEIQFDDFVATPLTSSLPKRSAPVTGPVPRSTTSLGGHSSSEGTVSDDSRRDHTIASAKDLISWARDMQTRRYDSAWGPNLTVLELLFELYVALGKEIPAEARPELVKAAIAVFRDGKWDSIRMRTMALVSTGIKAGLLKGLKPSERDALVKAVEGLTVGNGPGLTRRALELLQEIKGGSTGVIFQLKSTAGVYLNYYRNVPHSMRLPRGILSAS